MERKKRNIGGLWVVRDTDGLYLCNDKPWKNFYGEGETDFKWTCDGDFLKITPGVFDTKSIVNLKFTDEPIRVNITQRM